MKALEIEENTKGAFDLDSLSQTYAKEIFNGPMYVSQIHSVPNLWSHLRTSKHTLHSYRNQRHIIHNYKDKLLLQNIVSTPVNIQK